MEFFKLEPGRKYIHLFIVMVGLMFLFTMMFGEKFGGVFFFSGFCYLGVLQLRSHLVLNRSWIAQYRKGNYYKKFSALCIAVGVIGMLLVLASP
jgi:hypothetical protein